MWQRILTMLWKEFVQVLRDPRMRAIIFVMPVFQLFVFGYAATTDIRSAAVAIHDQDNTPESRALIARIFSSDQFILVAAATDERDAQHLIDSGIARAVLRINSGFQGDIHAGRTAHVQLILDGSDANMASLIAGYIGLVVTDYSQDVMLARFERTRGAARPPSQVHLVSRAWFNPNLESRNYYVPGVMVNLVSLVILMLTSMAIVREREVGTMEQIMVTPIRPIEFILGKTLPFVIIAYIDVALVSSVAAFWFEVPMRGSILFLGLATAVYVLPAVGLGLLISTICQTQQQAMLATFLFFLPAMLLSGFAYPIANMPEPVQWLTYLNPLRYFLAIVRGIFLKGIGFAELWPHLLALAAIGALLLTLATRRFHKTLS